MSRNVNNFSVVETVLAAAVADDATFTVAYPSGTTVASFSNGLASSPHTMIVNDNDVWSTAADPGILVSFGASEITITNKTNGSLAAGSNLIFEFDRQDGNDVIDLSFKVNLASITGSQDVVTDYSPGVDGVIESVNFVVDVPVTTAAKAASLNLEIGSTDVTGGVIALTSAAATPMGKVIAGTAITAANTITRDSKISIEASAVTAFAEGSGEVHVRIRKTASNAY